MWQFENHNEKRIIFPLIQILWNSSQEYRWKNVVESPSREEATAGEKSTQKMVDQGNKIRVLIKC